MHSHMPKELFILGYPDETNLHITEGHTELDTKYIRADLHTADSWRDISTAPRDGTEIIVYGVCKFEGAYMITAAYREDKGMFMCGCKTVGHSLLTHWQPLPQPPKAQE